MDLRFRIRRRGTDPAGAVVVVQATSGATVADLIEALGQQPGSEATPRRTPGRLLASGRVVPPTARLGHPPLVDTAYLEWVEDGDCLPASPPPTTGLLQLHVLRGPDAGLVAELGAGEHLLGRGRPAPLPLTDPSLSRDHALLRVSPTEITLVDRSSTNGTTVADTTCVPTTQTLRIGDEFTCGSTVFGLRTAPGMPAATRPDGVGHLLVTPAPRPPAKPTPAAIPIPSEPTPGPSPRLSVLGAVLPLAFGAALAVVMRSPTMLAFGLMGPAISVGTWWSERRAGRGADARTRRDYERVRADTSALVDAALADEAAERLAADPGPSTAVACALGPLSSLWDRTGSTPAEVRIGMGLVPAMTTTSEGPGLEVMAPVVLNLEEAGTTALVGPLDLTRAVARAIVTTAMARFDPHDLAVFVPSHVTSAWSWAEWAPHCRRSPLGDGGTPTRLTLRVTEGPSEPFSGHTLALVADETLLPTDCRRRISLAAHGDAPRGHFIRADGSSITVELDGMSQAAAARVVDALAPLRSPARHDAPLALPDRVSLQSLVGPLDAMSDRWRHTPRSTQFALGCASTDTDAPTVLDLALDGPHCLVGGTTGSGKSELLITMVATLAAANRPDELCFVLVDYKGGAAFGACRALPHVVGLVTDLDPAGAARAITSLTAELKRREGLLAARGCSDLTAYQRVCRAGDPTIPRLVIMIDEFRTLADEFPLLIDGLVRIAAQGRSLGIHLVVATQRPGGAVTADMRANLSLRVALRVRDAIDSLDVIDSPAAATLPADTPGRAIVTTATRGLITLQTGYANAPLATSAAPATIVSVDGIPTHHPETTRDDGPTALTALVDACHRAVADLGVIVPDSPWLGPLPALLETSQLPPPARERSAVVGIVDDPQAQAQYGWEFEPGRGSLAVSGGPKSGRSSALRTVATQLAARFAPTDLHVYAVHTGSLADLSHLPHCGAATTTADVCRVERLIRLLTEPSETPRVLLVDDLEQVLDSLGSPFPHVRDGLVSLLRHGVVGLTIVAGGGRALLTGSTAAGFSRRLLLLPADPVDLTLVGLRPGTVPAHAPPGRAVDPGSGLCVQLGLASPVDMPLSRTDPNGLAGQTSRSAVTVPALPRSTSFDHHAARDALPVATDGRDSVGFDLARGHRRIAVVGESGSGRSTALATLAAALRSHGREVVALDGRRLDAAASAGAELERFVARRKAHPDLAVLVDDAARLAGTPWDDVLAEVSRLVDEDDGFLAVAATPAEVARSPRGIVATVLTAETGLLLGHLDRGTERILGCRGPLVTEAIPGRGYLVHQGRATAVQVALAEATADVS